ncbi:alpha/beta hydrolase [Herbiconiux liukaitaii]|uniref:alpha/beta hydrolase n=1 Tax=Herbiconiux liukaitaii TaxID=3342799 RepID=UPI0035B99F2B
MNRLEFSALEEPRTTAVGSTVVDLYEADRPDAPAVIALHGGAWVLGSRSDYAERYRALRERGVTVAALDYRLATEAPYPAQRDDVDAVVRLLRERSHAGPGPAGPIAAGPIWLLGASAGAHLAALTAFSSNGIAGFIGLFGRYDLTSEADGLRPVEGLEVPADITGGPPPPLGARTHAERLALLAGVRPDDLHDLVLARISPVQQLHPLAPPLLLLHGTGDAVVDHRHSERLHERALALGVESELHLLPGANHEDPVFASEHTIGTIAAFIHRTRATIR